MSSWCLKQLVVKKKGKVEQEKMQTNHFKSSETWSCTACETGPITAIKDVSKCRLLSFTELAAAELSDRFR